MIYSISINQANTLNHDNSQIIITSRQPINHNETGKIKEILKAYEKVKANESTYSSALKSYKKNEELNDFQKNAQLSFLKAKHQLETVKNKHEVLSIVETK